MSILHPLWRGYTVLTQSIIDMNSFDITLCFLYRVSAYPNINRIYILIYIPFRVNRIFKSILIPYWVNIVTVAAACVLVAVFMYGIHYSDPDGSPLVSDSALYWSFGLCVTALVLDLIFIILLVLHFIFPHKSLSIKPFLKILKEYVFKTPWKNLSKIMFILKINYFNYCICLPPTKRVYDYE